MDEKKYKSTSIYNYQYLEAESGFRPYSVVTHKKWKQIVEKEGIENGEIGYLPDVNFFTGNKLLIKKGIVLEPKGNEHYFQGVSAFNDQKICFTATILSIKSNQEDAESKSFLSALSALFNSQLFTYFLLNTSSSAGIERSRIQFEEMLKFPIKWNNKLGELALEITNQFDVFSNPIVNTKIKNRLEAEIVKLYDISISEKALIDYALNVSIPILLREETFSVFNSLNLNVEKDWSYLLLYIDIIRKALQVRFGRIGKTLAAKIKYSGNFLRIDFAISALKIDIPEFTVVGDNDLDLLLGDLGIYAASKDLYFQQDVRGFTEKSFYIIKPNERKVWHSAIAYLDALEINEELTKAEIEISNLESIHERS